MINKKLNNQLTIPQIGFGVWQIPDDEAEEVVGQAIETGYRLIDTATIYNNESGVGKAIAQSNISREDLFITTKVWNTHHGYDKTLLAFEESMERLKVDYVDLYLVHWPAPRFDAYVETYKALEQLYKSGRTKAIGVCNFEIEHLQRIMDECDIVPAINQIECHPYLQQKELKEFCHKHNITVEAYSPLMNGTSVLKDPVIKDIAEKHKKTAAQIILRWHLQSDVVLIPKTVTHSRMQENINILDFELSASDMNAINLLDRNERHNAVPNEMHML